MKVLLAAVNAKYIHSNLAVYSLRAYAEQELQKEECVIEIGEYTINQQTDEILGDLYRHCPDVLCFSCYIWNLEYVEELVSEAAKILPNTEIWLGGPEVSYDARQVLERLPMAAGVMKGEGEETFLALLQNRLGKGEALSDIRGITFRWEEEIVENPWREIMDLSRVPFVYEKMENFAHRIIYYESSRGCPFSCSYCLSSIDKCLRFRDLGLVKKELQFFLDRKVEQVKFVDRTFNCSKEHALEIWSYIRDHDNGVTNFHFEVSADLFDEREFQVMETMRPGLIQLEIGVQSTNPRTVKEIRRTMRFDKVTEAVDRIRKMGNIHQHLDLIAGLPYEDYPSFARSFDEVYALQPDQLQLGFLKVLKGSYMEEQKEGYGLMHKSRPPYEVLCTKWLPYGDVLRLKGIEEMVEVYYNSRQFCYTLPRLVRRFSGPFAFFEALSVFYRENGFAGCSHSRISRYEILLDFAAQVDEAHKEEFRQLLTMDLYLRENVKSRPAFAGESRTEKSYEREFYQKEAEERRWLKGYEAFDGRQMRKMTHIETFTYDVTGTMERGCFRILFDYRKRSALDHQADFHILEQSSGCKKQAKSIQ